MPLHDGYPHPLSSFGRDDSDRAEHRHYRFRNSSRSAHTGSLQSMRRGTLLDTFSGLGFGRKIELSVDSLIQMRLLKEQRREDPEAVQAAVTSLVYRGLEDAT